MAPGGSPSMDTQDRGPRGTEPLDTDPYLQTPPHPFLGQPSLGL